MMRLLVNQTQLYDPFDIQFIETVSLLSVSLESFPSEIIHFDK